MALRLVEYATAGFAWDVAKQENCNILVKFYEPPGPGSPVGAPGIRHTEVRFNNGGPAELVMIEKRPWDEGETARRLTVTLK